MNVKNIIPRNPETIKLDIANADYLPSQSEVIKRINRVNGNCKYGLDQKRSPNLPTYISLLCISLQLFKLNVN
jgi:hypothetical protein